VSTTGGRRDKIVYKAVAIAFRDFLGLAGS